MCNLDCANDCELETIAANRYEHSLIRDYARNKLRAMWLRRMGRIGEALTIEHMLDHMYDRLPANIQW